ncbi:ABC transporter permease [Halosimplex sp. J119]
MGTGEQPAEPDDESPFRSQSDYDATAMDVYEVVFSRWVVSPLRVLWSDYRGRFGLIIVTFYVLVGTLGVVVIPEPSVDPINRLLSPLEQPNLQYLLGSDGVGRGLLPLMAHATPKMLKMMLAGAIFGNTLGVVVGLVAGYTGGNTDKILMTITDVVASVPALPLLLILAAIIEPRNPYLIGVILTVQLWAGLARGVRAQVLPLRNVEYVEASRTMGQSTSTVLIKQILPDLLPLVTLRFMSTARTVIFSSVALYFLGLLPYTSANWGVVLNSAYENSNILASFENAHWLLVPALTIALLTFGLTLLAQAFDQVFNPRVRARHEARRRADVEDEIDESDVDESNVSQMGFQ